MTRGNALKQDWQGPTAERLIHSMGSLVVGGDQQAGVVYQFKDSALQRTYEHLNHCASEEQRKTNDAELRALMKYHDAYVGGGLNGNMKSVDIENACFSSSSRDHAAKTDWEVDNRDVYRQANFAMTENQRLVVRIVVLEDCSLEQAGRALGKLSQRRAIQSGRAMLRKAGSALVELWGF